MKPVAAPPQAQAPTPEGMRLLALFVALLLSGCAGKYVTRAEFEDHVFWQGQRDDAQDHFINSAHSKANAIAPQEVLCRPCRERGHEGLRKLRLHVS